MPDVYIKVKEAPARILEGLATALEIRAADPQQSAMLRTYLNDAAVGPGARVLEVGCGTGAITRVLAAWPGVSRRRIASGEYFGHIAYMSILSRKPA